MDRSLDSDDESRRTVATLPLVGGHIALDFANTAGWHAGPEHNRVEHLHDYADVIAWSLHVTVLSPKQATVLLRTANQEPAAAREALTKARTWREAIYRVFAATTHPRTPAAADLDAIWQGRIRALRAGTPTWSRHAMTVAWPEKPHDLLRPLYPVLIAAAELLESGQLDRLRQCGNDPCGWLFLDRTKNRSRRWCSTAECGNLTRVRRFRARQ
ncbi:MAG: CGNR zinc finger domain-containing protein [Gemmatimonadales bacterium]